MASTPLSVQSPKHSWAASRRARLVASTLAHYQIKAAIGGGGMGEVYRATDTKLGREVALKVLPQAVANDPERLARFQREARAVAALNHPNVVTLYSVEESNGVHFLTMELIEGESLDHLIPTHGLSAEQNVEFGNAIAEALAAAHEKGIIHRDLKPANVMVTKDGRVKVLDFGLAKDLSAETASEATLTAAGQTQAGMVMGTPAYMSPEQVSGRTLDHRTDIFSLGVLLHEMATGRRPFDGASSAELVSAILRDNPPPVTDLRADLPSDLARVIRRCLEKDPRHRLQTARDVANEFRDMARGTSTSLTTPASPSRATKVHDSGAARTDEGFWVAVLPFKYAGSNADLLSLAEGLTDDVITGMSRFSYLRVIARNSTARHSLHSGDLRATGKELGARYVMEGSLRQAGSKLRVAVQLIDTETGAHLWAETYERTFQQDSLFELQDDLVPRIVSTVADQHGVLPRTMSELLRGKSKEALTPHEAVLRAFSYFSRMTAEEHAAVREILEHAVRKAPEQADCWAMLSTIYSVEFADGFDPRPNSLDLALAAAQRAVDLAPTHALGHYALAFACFFRKEMAAFRAAVERTLALNPMDGSTLGLLAVLTHYSGEVERGRAMAQTALGLNPNATGLLRFLPFTDAYVAGHYDEALSAAVRINLPGFYHFYSALAAAHGQLGHQQAAQKTVRDLLALRPNFAAEARQEYSKWYNPQQVEHFLDGLRKAGLPIPDQTASYAAPPSTSVAPQLNSANAALRTSSGSAPATASQITTTSSGKSASDATRSDEGFWVAVLPFRYSGNQTDVAALAEGLTDEIITGMSRFSYLRVVARSSMAKYAQQGGDVRAIGKEIGARYVMEGSLRQAGSKLRVAVQLVDAVSGAHLWAETYERAFHPDSLFEVQDDLVPRVVATVADQFGVLPRSMSEVLRSKSAASLTPHEAVLRAFTYFARISPDEHGAVRTILERSVREAPDHADSWALLSMIYRGEYAQGFNAQPHPLDRALAAARRAVDLAPTHALGHYALATVYFFRKELAAFRVEADKALTLNPLDASARAYLGLLISNAGEWERGIQMVASALQLNPNCPGYFYFADCWNAYLTGRYEEVLEHVARINMPNYFHVPAITAAALAQLGRHEEASKAVQDLLALRPDFAAVARHEYAKWFESAKIEPMIEGLRKAGLDIP